MQIIEQVRLNVTDVIQMETFGGRLEEGLLRIQESTATSLSVCLHTQNVYHEADIQRVRPVPYWVLSGSW